MQRLKFSIDISKFPEDGQWDSVDSETYGAYNDWRLVLRVCEGKYYDDAKAWIYPLLDFADHLPISALPLPSKRITFLFNKKNTDLYTSPLTGEIISNSYVHINFRGAYI